MEIVRMHGLLRQRGRIARAIADRGQISGGGSGWTVDERGHGS
jgi:hypothetical protein